ncbi:MAG: hypothetical protein ACXAEN_26265 [Candidatus Thorarchaeota archaeon]|jgi:predicted transcriptional regulator
MTDEEFKKQLSDRRDELQLTYTMLQKQTRLGYNTVRRVFSDPMNCRIGSVIRVVTALGCYLDFSVEDKISDELESDVPVA